MNKMKSQTTKGLCFATLISFFSLIFISCEKLLDVEVEGIVSEDIYEDQEGIEKALAGAYHNLGGVYDGFEGGELFGGDFTVIPTLILIEGAQYFQWLSRGVASEYAPFSSSVKNFSADNSRIESNWRRSYETINILNTILASTDNIDDQTAKDRIEGEAMAMRGIIYFEIVRLWGVEYAEETKSELAIPLLLEPITQVKQIQPAEAATIETIYNQIQKDLEEASTKLENFSTNQGGISYFACQAYLMRMNMHKDEFQAAIDNANTIIGFVPGTFDLTDDPLDAFNNSSNSFEDIFAIQQNAISNSGNITTGTGIASFYSSLNGVGNGNMGVRTSFLYNSLTGGVPNSPDFSDNDLRGSLDTETNDNASIADINTFFYQNLKRSSIFISPAKHLASGNNIPVIRLAEIYLSRSEAIFRQNSGQIDLNSLADLNLIRTRSGLPDLQSSDFSSPDELLDSIKLERKREFFLEGITFHDLKRWGDSIDHIVASDPKYLLPIPQAECDASPGLCE